MITIQVNFWGAFRKYGNDITLNLTKGCTVLAIKSALQERLGGDGLVTDSVLADNSHILGDDDILLQNTTLSILPPVCGG